MKAVSRFVFQRFCAEIREKPIAVGNRFGHCAKCHGMVCGGDCVCMPKINLILTRSFPVVGAFRLDAHLLQGQADLPADVLPLVVGGEQYPYIRPHHMGFW